MTDALESVGLVALADRIELWPIDRLRPYERNLRAHSEAQVDLIAASMVEFGWTNPTLVDENAGILAGHGRLLAASKLGPTEVPVIRFEHLSEAQKRAYLIADNQLALQAGCSEKLLAAELAWLRDESFDLDPGSTRRSWSGSWRSRTGEAASDEAEDEAPRGVPYRHRARARVVPDRRRRRPEGLNRDRGGRVGAAARRAGRSIIG